MYFTKEHAVVFVRQHAIAGWGRTSQDTIDVPDSREHDVKWSGVLADLSVRIKLPCFPPRIRPLRPAMILLSQRETPIQTRIPGVSPTNLTSSATLKQ